MYFKSKIIEFHKSPYSPHMIVPTLVRPKSYILDVGCNAGYIGKYLKQEKSCTCDGIDIDESALTKAKPFYKNLYKIDLFKDDFKIKNKYDYLLFIDILEHLPNPEVILKKLIKNNLKNDGLVIICLPNIARFELRLKHLLGNFDYSPGIMNEDHLRFFTYQSGKKLLKESGLKILKTIPTGLGAIIKIFPNLTSFQFIYICKK